MHIWTKVLCPAAKQNWFLRGSASSVGVQNKVYDCHLNIWILSYECNSISTFWFGFRCDQCNNMTKLQRRQNIFLMPLNFYWLISLQKVNHLWKLSTDFIDKEVTNYSIFGQCLYRKVSWVPQPFVIFSCPKFTPILWLQFFFTNTSSKNKITEKYGKYVFSLIWWITQFINF